MRSSWFGLAILCCAFAWVDVATASEHSTEDLIRGVVARYDAVFSGRMKYRMTSGFRGKKPDEAFAHDLTFSTTSWRLDVQYPFADLPLDPKLVAQGKVLDPVVLAKAMQVNTVSHGGKFVEYKATPQDDGSYTRRALISAERPLRPNKIQAPPVFAGSFWYECTKQFVQKNAVVATRQPPAQANGVLCQVLEWKVSKEQAFKAFHSVNADSERGGTLRLYISPELGYTLPRVECISDKGVISAAYDASDFKDCGDGKFIPHRCSLQCNDADGPGFYLDYLITEVKRVNDRFADKEFVLELPVGTIVSDARSGTHSTWFELKEETAIPTDLVDVIRLPSWRFFRRNPIWALSLGGVAGVVVLLAAYFGWKKIVARRKK